MGFTQQRARVGGALVSGLTEPLIKGDEVSAGVETDTQPRQLGHQAGQTGPGVRRDRLERDANGIAALQGGERRLVIVLPQGEAQSQGEAIPAPQ